MLSDRFERKKTVYVDVVASTKLGIKKQKITKNYNVSYRPFFKIYHRQTIRKSQKTIRKYKSGINRQPCRHMYILCGQYEDGGQS